MYVDDVIRAEVIKSLGCFKCNPILVYGKYECKFNKP